jgi:hypothetical protein
MRAFNEEKMNIVPNVTEEKHWKSYNSMAKLT